MHPYCDDYMEVSVYHLLSGAFNRLAETWWPSPNGVIESSDRQIRPTAGR